MRRRTLELLGARRARPTTDRRGDVGGETSEKDEKLLAKIVVD